MKINFRKISAIAVSALMTGMTLGVAAAANYPAPFVSGGVANVAVVYGTGAGVSTLDLVQAGNIQTSLGTFVEGGKVTVEGGEAFALEKTSNKFNFNNTLNEVYADLDDQEMPEFLADGDYNDGNVDETYTQKITLGTKRLSLFADSDYNNKVPTLGFRWTNNENILKYDFTPDDGILFNSLNDTEIPLMGKSYYVLNAVPGTINLLDSAEKVVLKEGDTVTVGDKTVSIEFIDTDEVKFNVDGEITNKLVDHGYEELNDGSYIVANEVMYNSKEVGISSVEFSIGKGKMTLKNGDEVKVNDEIVDGLAATITGDTATGLTNLNFNWTSDDETFLTEEDAITMPVFETIKLVFGGIDFPDSSEAISLETGETMTLAMGNYELPLFNSVTSALGEEDYVLVTAINDSLVSKWGFANTTATGNTANTTSLTGGLVLAEDNRFLVTTVDTDLTDVQTMYYEVTNIDWDGTDVLVELRDLIGSKDLTFDAVNESLDQGDVTVNLVQATDTNIYLRFSGATIAYDKAVSEKGLTVDLPGNTALGINNLEAGVVLTLTEADKDGDIAEGMPFTMTVKNSSNDKLHISANNVTSSTMEISDNVELGYVPSDLASKITFDTSADEYEFSIDYYGQEVAADVQVVGGLSTTTSGDSTLGNVLVKDSEVSSVATKNLIVVGGSCINSAAAALVGGAKCGAAWTAATGIGSGQSLIKGYATSSITSKLALLVAGYDAADTVKATTYLTNKVVDTSKAYKVTTTTEVGVVIE